MVGAIHYGCIGLGRPQTVVQGELPLGLVNVEGNSQPRNTRETLLNNSQQMRVLYGGSNTLLVIELLVDGKLGHMRPFSYKNINLGTGLSEGWLEKEHGLRHKSVAKIDRASLECTGL